MAKGIVYTVYGKSGSNLTKAYVSDNDVDTEWLNIKSTEGYFVNGDRVASAKKFSIAWYPGALNTGMIYGGVVEDTYNIPVNSHNPLTQHWWDPGQRAMNQLRVASAGKTAETVTITTAAGTNKYEIITNANGQVTAGNIPLDLSGGATVKAHQALTLSANLSNTETVTIGTKVYTLQDVLTNADGNVQIGADAKTTIQNLVDAINLTGTPGTQYALAMTKHTSVSAVKTSDTVLTATAINGGTAGNSIATTETSATASWGNTTLLLGVDPTAANVVDGLLATINTKSTNGTSAIKISANELVVQTTSALSEAGACSETLSGANNAWGSATFYGGETPGQRKLSYQARVPKAQEVTLGNMHFLYDFAPTGVINVQVIPTATPGIPKAWDGAITVSGNRITLDNTGNVDFAATDTVYVWASE